jgi:hypothetical protein
MSLEKELREAANLVAAQKQSVRLILWAFGVGVVCGVIAWWLL